MAEAPQDSNRTPPAFAEGEARQRPTQLGQSVYTQQPVYMHPSGQGSSVGGQPPQYRTPGQNAPQQSGPVYPQPQGGALGLTLSFDMGALLRTQVGCAKIVEFFVLGTAWAAALKYNEMCEKTEERTAFFLGATISAWAISILCIVNTIFGGTKDVCNPMDSARFSINIFIVLDIIIAVSTSIMAKRASDLASVYDDYPDQHANIIALYIAVGFGFVSFFTLLVDLIMYCKEYSFYFDQQGFQQFQNQPTYAPQQYGQYGAQRGDRLPESVVSFPAPE